MTYKFSCCFTGKICKISDKPPETESCFSKVRPEYIISAKKKPIVRGLRRSPIFFNFSMFDVSSNLLHMDNRQSHQKNKLESNGLRVNIGKTKVMFCGKKL